MNNTFDADALINLHEIMGEVAVRVNERVRKQASNRLLSEWLIVRLFDWLRSGCNAIRYISTSTYELNADALHVALFCFFICSFKWFNEIVRFTFLDCMVTTNGVWSTNVTTTHDHWMNCIHMEKHQHLHCKWNKHDFHPRHECK